MKINEIMLVVHMHCACPCVRRQRKRNRENTVLYIDCAIMNALHIWKREVRCLCWCDTTGDNIERDRTCTHQIEQNTLFASACRICNNFTYRDIWDIWLQCVLRTHTTYASVYTEKFPSYRNDDLQHSLRLATDTFSRIL